MRRCACLPDGARSRQAQILLQTERVIIDETRSVSLFSIE